MRNVILKSFMTLENKYVPFSRLFSLEAKDISALTFMTISQSLNARGYRIARLKQKSLKLAREEYLKNQSDKDESPEITMEKVNCPKCRGDGNESSTTHIQDLCPDDRKKITQLISELARCTQERHKVTAALEISKADNEALQNQFQLLNNQHEDDKNRLRSQLSSTRTEMAKLKLQTSHSLNLLTEQIVALENQSTRLIEAVKDLLSDKIYSHDALIKQKKKAIILEAKIDEIKKSNDMENLLLLDQTSQKSDKDCQTEARANSQEEVYTCSRIKILETNPASERLLKTTQVKSKYDLDEPSSEAILLRELFFKHPSIDENEGLDLFPQLPRN